MPLYKKPPVTGFPLANYAGGAILNFRYHDHNIGEQATGTLSQNEIATRLKQHILEKFSRIILYSGFLSNRVRGKKLPQVHAAQRIEKPQPVPQDCYSQMSKQFLRLDPFECVLCGGMVYLRAMGVLMCRG